MAISFASPTTARADYVAPAGCPAEDAWRQDAMTPDGREPSGMDVRIAREGDEYIGRLTTSDGAPREVRAPDCQSVAHALATIASLSAPAPISGPAAPAVSLAPVPPPTAPNPTPRLDAAHSHPWTLVAGVSVSAGTPLLGASVSLAGSVFLEAHHDTGWPVLGRIGFEQGLADSNELSRATRSVGSLELCPWAWRLRTLRARPCGRFDAGFVRAAGTQVTNARGATLPWLETGTLLRADAPLGPFVVGAEVGAFAPLLRHSVELNGGVSRADLPVWATRGGIFVAVAFW
jgi:hypothetical protein